jgi:hypothetical protein
MGPSNKYLLNTVSSFGIWWAAEGPNLPFMCYFRTVYTNNAWIICTNFLFKLRCICLLAWFSVFWFKDVHRGEVVNITIVSTKLLSCSLFSADDRELKKQNAGKLYLVYKTIVSFSCYLATECRGYTQSDETEMWPGMMFTEFKRSDCGLFETTISVSPLREWGK